MKCSYVSNNVSYTLRETGIERLNFYTYWVVTTNVRIHGISLKRSTRILLVRSYKQRGGKY